MKRKKQAWFIHAKKADFKGLAEKLGIDPVTVRLLVNRDIPPEKMQAYLTPDYSALHDPSMLLDGEKAAGLILAAIRAHLKIRIIGDYDIDGIMSVYILHQGLLKAGADADWDIPHRVRDGYGLNVRLVEKAHADHVGLIVTCDNGIAAADAIERAESYGIAVVVTDHHAVPFETGPDGAHHEILPSADAVVDPHRAGDPYPWKEICGAVVAWKEVTLLYRQAGILETEADCFLPYAAFATIGDIMTLQDENRLIVKKGLAALPGIENRGMQALMEATGTDITNMSAFRIGFVLGPCFNAAGRLETAALGVSLLEAKTDEDAEALAARLVALNETRKEMTRTGTEQALSLLDSGDYRNDRVLVLYEPDLPESVCGIVAGRVKEETNRPTIVLADGQDCVKGSGRSIPGYSMFEKLSEVKDLLTKFGGHPMAAGMSLMRENVEPLRRMLNSRSGLSEQDLTEKVMIDCRLPLWYLSSHPELMDELALLEPFGNGNEKPLFCDSGLRVIRMRPVGKEGQYLKFELLDAKNCRMSALYFGDGPSLVSDLRMHFSVDDVERAQHGQKNSIVLSVTYEPVRNTWNGVESTEIRIRDVIL